MGRRCKLDGIEVCVVIGDELPDYEFRALQEIIKKERQANERSFIGKALIGRHKKRYYRIGSRLLSDAKAPPQAPI